MSFYHDGQRAIQQRFQSAPLADRLSEKLRRNAFSDADKAFIESVSFFFIATADAEGRPDCSHKGGAAGFVRIIEPSVLAFPDYDGNGMFRSLGNIHVNPAVGLLFIAMNDAPKRLRVNGRATVSFDDPLMPSLAGAQAVIRIDVEHIFPNCPRYIADLSSETPSQYAPKEGVAPIEPAWKSFPDFKDVVPPRKA